MKLLKIEGNQGHFRIDQDDFALIDKITKEDLLRLVNLTLTEDVEFDEFNDETIKNKAHQILYKSISEKIADLIKRKKGFTDESERLYLEEYEKYRDKPSQQGAEGDAVSTP